MQITDECVSICSHSIIYEFWVHSRVLFHRCHHHKCFMTLQPALRWRIDWLFCGFIEKKNNRIGMRHYVIRPQSRVEYSFSFGVAAACTLLFYQFVNFDKYRSYRFVVPILLSMCDQNRMARTNVFIKTFCNTVRFGSRIIVRHHVYVEPWKITNLISQSSAFGHIKYEYTAKRLLGWLKRCLATILSRLPANSFGECRSCAADPVSSNNNANCSNCNYGYIMCWANTRPTR